MGQIPNWFMVLSGIIVSVVSYFLGNNFRVFFYVGLVFFFYGLVNWYVLRGKKVNVKDVSNSFNRSQNRIYNNHSNQMHDNTRVMSNNSRPMHDNSRVMHDNIRNYFYCRNCGSVVKPNDNFCFKCGFRLR